MRLHRFIGNYNLSKDRVFITDKAIVNQIRKVLRYHIGSKLILSDGEGNEAICEIIDFGRNLIECSVIERKEDISDYKREIVLFCSVLKNKNFELAIQKTCEIGVSQIVPIITQHTVKMKLRYDRLVKILKEASEQSGRSVVPKITDIMKFDEALDYSKGCEANVLFDSSGSKFRSFSNYKKVGVWIGPEGGWTDKEISIAQEAGFEIAKLGKLTLRAETAAIVAAFLALNM